MAQLPSTCQSCLTGCLLSVCCAQMLEHSLAWLDQAVVRALQKLNSSYKTVTSTHMLANVSLHFPARPVCRQSAQSSVCLLPTTSIMIRPGVSVS